MRSSIRVSSWVCEQAPFESNRFLRRREYSWYYIDERIAISLGEETVPKDALKLLFLTAKFPKKKTPFLGSKAYAIKALNQSQASDGERVLI
jgi:hypothetical protein